MSSYQHQHQYQYRPSIGPSTVENFDSNSADIQLTPRSIESCYIEGIEPTELLREPPPSTEYELNDPFQIKRREHYEKRRLAKLTAVRNTRRGLLIKQSRRHSNSTATAVSAAGNSNSPTRPGTSHQYSGDGSPGLAERLDRIAREESKRARQLAEKQQREIAATIAAELAHSKVEAEEKRVEQQRLAKLEADKLRQHHRAVEWAQKQSRTAQFKSEQESAVLIQAELVRQRDREEKEKIAQQRLAAEADRKQIAAARAEERQLRLQAVKENDQQRADEIKRQYQIKIAESTIKTATLKSNLYTLNQNQSKLRSSAPPLSSSTGTGDSELEQQAAAIAAERLREFQAQQRAEKEAAARRLAEKKEKSDRAKESFNESIAAKQMELKLREQEREAKRAAIEADKKASREAFKLKEQQRLQVKSNAAQLAADHQQSIEYQIQQKEAQLAEREAARRSERENRDRQRALASELAESDKREMEARKQRAAAYKEQQLRQSVEQQLEKSKLIQSQHSKSLAQTYQLKLSKQKEQESIINKFKKLKQKVNGELHLDQLNLNELGLDNNILESIKQQSLSSNKPSLAQSLQHSQSYNEYSQNQINKANNRPRSAAAPVSIDYESKDQSAQSPLNRIRPSTANPTANKLSASESLAQLRSSRPSLTGTKSASKLPKYGTKKLFNRPKSAVKLASSASSQSINKSKSQSQSQSQSQYSNLSALDKESYISDLASQQNGYLLMLLEREQSNEIERQRIYQSITDEIELNRLNKIFSIERGKAAEIIKTITKEHEIELAQKMKELGMLSDDDSDSESDNDDNNIIHNRQSKSTTLLEI